MDSARACVNEASQVCPTNLPGPKLAPVPVPDSCGHYCVDSTEVTNAQYAEFLAENDSGVTDAGGGDGDCSWNTTYVPSTGWPAPGMGDYAVVYVDWCDAHAYCAWAGKHLCGKIGGAPFLTGDGGWVPMEDEWVVACSKGGTQGYPYGTYDPNACNTGSPAGPAPPLPVPTKSTCEGGYPGLFDLSGNVDEWVNRCSGPRANDPCDAVGGSRYFIVDFNFMAVSCSGGAGAQDRKGTYAAIGFRCCANAR